MYWNYEFCKGNVFRECSFKKKTLIAEQCGARAIIITDITSVDDEYFVEMIDDDKTQDVHIPAAFLLGKNGLMITRTLKRLNKQYAIINLPVNLTFTPIHEINEPPWLGWWKTNNNIEFVAHNTIHI